MRVLAGLGSRWLRRWDLDRAHLAALASMRRRTGLAVAATAASAGPARSRTASSYIQFALFVVLGLTGVVGILSPSFFMGLVFSYTLIMLMLGLPLLTHCTLVLLDTSENRVLLHLPISGRTLLAARLLGIAKHAGFLALSVGLPTAVALAVRFGAIALLVFVISLFLATLLVVAVILANCLFVLRHVNPARIRQGILWFQTALVVLAVYAGTLVLSADVPLVKLMPVASGQTWWYLYPPAWMAGLMDYTLMEATRFNAVLAATAILAPLAGFFVCMLGFAGGRFTALLSRLEVVPRGKASSSRRLPGWLARLSRRIPALMNGDPQQRAVFALTTRLMKADASLRRRIYAYSGAILINSAIIIAKFHHRPIEDLQLFMLCYMPLFLAVTGPLIQYGAEWRAAWCYQVLPFAKPGVVISGAITAYLWNYIFPICLFLLIVSGVVWGAAAALDALFAGVAIALVCIVRFWSAAPSLPYASEPALMLTRTEGSSRRLAFIPIVVGLIVTHVLLASTLGGWGVAGGIVAMAGAIVVAFRKLRFAGRFPYPTENAAPAQ